MKLAYAALAAASLAALSQPAVAQEAQAPSAQQMAPVSDAELENFVIAASMIGQIQRSEEIAGAEKEKAAMQVLSQAQMTPQRFNMTTLVSVVHRKWCAPPPKTLVLSPTATLAY